MAVSDEVNLFARWMQRNRHELSGRVSYRLRECVYRMNIGSGERFFFADDSTPLTNAQWWRNG